MINALTKRLRELMRERGWGIDDVATASGQSYETIRNLYYGKTANPRIETLLKVADVFGISVNCLMGKCQHTPEERALLQYYRSSGNHGKALILLTAKYEALTAKEEREGKDRHSIPCLTPKGNIRDGIIYDEATTEEMHTTNLEAYVGIKMTTNDLVPAYCKGDVILIANRFPRHNEYGVFYKNGRAYIRQYLEEDGQYRLKCLHNYAEDIICKRMDEIDYIGTCCGVIRA